jgi:hypothetical protein
MARIRFIDRQTLNRGIVRDLEVFDRGVRAATRVAAEVATSSSQKRFTTRLSKRPTIGPRPTGTRPTTQGTFASHIQWRPIAGGSRVGVAIGKLQNAAPYWLIQEIGTGNSAQVRTPGAAAQARGGQGRDGPRIKGNVSVKSQAGRRIPSGLVWSGNSPGRDQIIAGPWRQPITIRHEIEGKNYLRTGGRSGFAAYERGLDNAFDNAFKGRHPKP